MNARKDETDMNMRVVDKSTTRNYLENLNSAKYELSKTTNQISTGNRFIKASEDVASATRVMYSRMDMYKAETHLANVEIVSDELEMAEDSMMSTSEILIKAHELAIRAMSEEKGDTGRDVISEEIRNLKDQILNFSNTKFGNKFVFGGSNSSPIEPFTADPNTGDMLYNGVPVDDIQKDVSGYFYNKNDASGNPIIDPNTGLPQRFEIPMDEDVFMDVGLGIKMNESQVQDETVFKISYSGLDIYGFGKDPDTGYPRNIYNLLADLEESIASYDTDKIGEVDKHLSSAADTFTTNITDMGAKTDFLETMQTRLDKTVDLYKEKINGLMGTKDEEAIMTLTMNQYVLSAVQQMGSRILPVSLMDFLR